jgi:hypothetical protein
MLLLTPAFPKDFSVFPLADGAAAGFLNRIFERAPQAAVERAPQAAVGFVCPHFFERVRGHPKPLREWRACLLVKSRSTKPLVIAIADTIKN